MSINLELKFDKLLGELYLHQNCSYNNRIIIPIILKSLNNLSTDKLCYK